MSLATVFVYCILGRPMDIRPLLVILFVCGQIQAMTIDTDYGGLPLQIDRFLGEPTVFTLRNRVDSKWSWMVSSQNCSVKCDCAIQWPTALYCDHKGLEQFPEHLPSRTQYLFLQGNMVTGFNSKVFANCTNLRWLILDQNHLLSSKLDSGALFNLTRLVNLFMNHNNLTEVPAGLPDGLKQLRLSYNQIGKISPGAFANLRNLTLLLLQGNRLKTIGETDFKGMALTSAFIALICSLSLSFIIKTLIDVASIRNLFVLPKLKFPEKGNYCGHGYKM